MCFSATASFISGATLCIIALQRSNKLKASAEVPFAKIPLLFLNAGKDVLNVLNG